MGKRVANIIAAKSIGQSNFQYDRSMFSMTNFNLNDNEHSVTIVRYDLRLRG